MSAQLAQLQEDRDQYQEQLDLVLAPLRDDPENEELLKLKEELQTALQMIDDAMAELKPKAASSSGRNHNKRPSAASPPSSPAKASSRGPAAGADDDDSSAAPATYKVNESILARWVTGDKGFYPARIMSITGSATAPLYTVKFKSYDTIETLRARDIRPLSNNSSSAASSSKRKAESMVDAADHSKAVSNAFTAPLSPARTSGASTPSTLLAPPPPPPPSSTSSSGAPPPPPPPSEASSAAHTPLVFGGRTIDRFNNGIVSSAAAQLYPQAALLQEQQQQQQQQRGGSGSPAGAASGSASSAGGAPGAGGADEPAPKKFKKIKATKQLEAGKSKWQEFSNKSKFAKSSGKKDSMFRTPEGIHGRVGFTGSGQAMRKDPTRSRHIYQTNEDLD